MSIFAMADLHLSFGQDKPMNIFGDNWDNHAEKIKDNWIKKVKEEDYVILPGDFSWATYLEDTRQEFEFLNGLPGHKILLKGNHDYWWTTVTNMRNYLKENNFNNIDFLYNNSYLIEGKIVVGTRGWNILDTDEDSKMIHRECARLKLSIENAIQNYGNDKEMIVFFHYPPITKSIIHQNETTEFVKLLSKYNIKRCYYGHLHGNSHNDAVMGNIRGIEYKLISADFLNFELVEI